MKDCRQQLFICLFDIQKMICFALKKTLVDANCVNTVVTRLRQLLEPIESFVEFSHKVFLLILYEIMRLIHVNLHLQKSIKILLLCIFGRSPNPWLILMVINLVIGTKVLLKSTSTI
jgi:hypothetical protein